MGPKTVTRLVILIAIVVVASLSIFFLQRSQVTRMAKSVLGRRRPRRGAVTRRRSRNIKNTC